MSDYNLEGVSWGTTAPLVTWSLAQNNYSDRGYQFSSFLTPEFLSDVQAVFNKWSSVANINFQEVADSDASDIRIGFNSIDGLYNTAGITSYSATYDSSGSALLTQADIEMDKDEGWHLSNESEYNSSNSVKFYSILLHEVGHAIGLAHYDDAPAIMNAINSVPDLTTSDIDGVQAIYGPRNPSNPQGGPDTGFTESYNNQGFHVVDITESAVTASSVSQDVFRNYNQASTTFVFNPGFGHDIIAGFVPSSDQHGTLDLPSEDFAGVADVLRHTQSTSGGAVIHDTNSGDTIKLVGISKADLIQNRQSDLAFHA